MSNLLHTPKTVCLANIQHLILVIFFEPGNILVSEKVWKRLNSPWTEKQRIVSAPIITSFARNMISAMIWVLDISYRFCDLPRTKVLVKFKRMHICKIYLDDLERNKDHILCQKVQIWAWFKRVKCTSVLLGLFSLRSYVRLMIMIMNAIIINPAWPVWLSQSLEIFLSGHLSCIMTHLFHFSPIFSSKW